MKRGVVWGSLLSYGLVIAALTLLKTHYRIGHLWSQHRQHVRSLELIPLDMIVYARSWFEPAFEYSGNVAFFVPLGLLLAVLLEGREHPVRAATLAGFCASLAIEATQFALAIGRTDIDDLWCNTLGAFLGAWLATKAGTRWQPVWVWFAILLEAVFAVVVAVFGRFGAAA